MFNIQSCRLPNHHSFMLHKLLKKHISMYLYIHVIINQIKDAIYTQEQKGWCEIMLNKNAPCNLS